MKNKIFTTLSLAILATITPLAHSEYLVQVSMKESGITFVKNSGLPNGGNGNESGNGNGNESGNGNGSTEPTDPETTSCTITSPDFAPFGGVLYNVGPQDGYKCVVNIGVPKQTFDGACNPNVDATNGINFQLWNMMRSKGVDGVSSIAYLGECNGDSPIIPAPEPDPLPESCKITNADFAPWGGSLYSVHSEPNGFKCVAQINVPKRIFDNSCNPNSEIRRAELFSMMNSKGVDSVSSFGYIGECE